jgi:hypothetical protein
LKSLHRFEERSLARLHRLLVKSYPYSPACGSGSPPCALLPCNAHLASNIGVLLCIGIRYISCMFVNLVQPAAVSHGLTPWTSYVAFSKSYRLTSVHSSGLLQSVSLTSYLELPKMIALHFPPTYYCSQHFLKILYILIRTSSISRKKLY